MGSRSDRHATCDFPGPAAVASAWQCASAPAKPPRFAPSPLPTLVTKNDIGGGGVPCRPPGADPGWRLPRRRRGWLLRENQSRHGHHGQHRGSKDTLCAIHIYSPSAQILSLIEGLRPSNSPTRSLARRCDGALRSRGSPAVLARTLERTSATAPAASSQQPRASSQEPAAVRSPSSSTSLF